MTDANGASEAELRAARNCDGQHAENGACLDLPFAPNLQRCPWAAIERRAFDLWHAFVLWKDIGILPFPGAIGDQPQPIVEAFALFARELARADAKAAAEARAAALAAAHQQKGMSGDFDGA